jgi:drug/metabolite transporter (DMT)-like permease
MLESCFCYSLMYCIVKYMSISIHPLTLLFYRNLLASIFILPFITQSLLTKKNIISLFNFTNFIRGILGFISMSLWFIALSGSFVTEVVAISFLTPIITCMLAVVFLQEKFNIIKIFSLLIGFIGAYVIIHPNTEGGLNQFALYAFLSCFSWAVSNVLVKKLSKDQEPVIIVFYMSLVVMLCSVPWLLMNWHLPTLKEFLLMSIIAILSNMAQVLIAKSYKKTDVTIVMPFDFTRLIFSSILAYLLFSEPLKFSTFLGSIIIIIAGYILTKSALKK